MSVLTVVTVLDCITLSTCMSKQEFKLTPTLNWSPCFFFQLLLILEIPDINVQ